jgi:next-to-BRCA1 protein 1
MIPADASPAPKPAPLQLVEAGISYSPVIVPVSAKHPEDIPQTATSPIPDLLTQSEIEAEPITSPFSDIHQISRPIEPQLQATFLADNNIPDGQVVLAGAQFVKSWLMQNNGDVAWSEGTVIAFVGGNRLGGGEAGVAMSYEVGKVEPGTAVDVNVMDMQAPEEPGKYLSFWRLKDEKGNFFGPRLWCEIVVPEPESSGSSASVADSSVIMMPSLTTANLANLATMEMGSQPASGIAPIDREHVHPTAPASYTLPSEHSNSRSNSISLTHTSTLESDLVSVSEDSDAAFWAETRPSNTNIANGNNSANGASGQSGQNGRAVADGSDSEDEAEFILVSDRSSTDGF